MKVVVISAGHAPTSGTSRLARLVGESVAERLAAEAQHLELREFALEVTASLLDGRPGDRVTQAIDVVRHADAVALLTPTINASFSGLLKSFLDVLPRDLLRGMPILIGATGGTNRHTLVLDQSVRPMLAFQRAVVTPGCLYVTADEWDGARPRPELRTRLTAAVDELGLFVSLSRSSAGESSLTR